MSRTGWKIRRWWDRMSFRDGARLDLDDTVVAIDGTQITASAAELNRLDGVSANVTAANLNGLTGGAGVVAAAGGHGHVLANGATDVIVPVAEVNLLNGLTATAGVLNTTEYSPGVKASAVLRVDGDVADGEEVEIGADTYQVEVVATDSTDDTAGGSWDNTTNPLTVDLAGAGYANVRGAIGVGDLIRVESEIMRCTDIDGTEHTFQRGASGTTNATHANGQDILLSAAPFGPAAPPAEILVGLGAAVTPAAFSPAITADVNSEGTEAITAQVISNNQVLVFADVPGVNVTALAESLMTADNVWDTAALRGGINPGLRRCVVVERVPNAVEAALDRVLIPVDFAPTAAIVQIRVTATGEPVAWDGNTILRTVEQRVDLINSGIVDFAATDTITAVIYG
jgi:hypothetical protein